MRNAESRRLTQAGPLQRRSNTQTPRCELPTTLQRAIQPGKALHFSPAKRHGFSPPFTHITRNWKGVPLETLEIVVSLIGSTTTEEGLEVHAWLDSQTYEKGRTVSDTELSAVQIKRNPFHGDWNYEVHPRRKSQIR